MLGSPIVIAIMAVGAAAAAVPCYQNTTSLTQFNAPTAEPFLHADLAVSQSTNTSTELGLVVRFPNAGNVTGQITATVFPLGTAYELIHRVPDGIRSLLVNQFTLETTAPFNSTIIMNGDIVVQYANKALYGIGSVRFEGWPGTNITYEQFVGQVQADFQTGKAFIDVHKLVPAGRVDGKPRPSAAASGVAYMLALLTF